MAAHTTRGYSLLYDFHRPFYLYTTNWKSCPLPGSLAIVVILASPSLSHLSSAQVTRPQKRFYSSQKTTSITAESGLLFGRNDFPVQVRLCINLENCPNTLKHNRCNSCFAQFCNRISSKWPSWQHSWDGRTWKPNFDDGKFTRQCSLQWNCRNCLF